MHSLKWYLKFIQLTMKNSWNSYISSKGWSFFSMSMAYVISYLGEYTVLLAAIQNFREPGGFVALEVGFTYGMLLTCYALGNISFVWIWKLSDMLLRGELDEPMLRPMSPLIYLIFTKMGFGYIAHISLGVGSMILMKILLGISWTVAQWIAFPIVIISGSMCMAGISAVPAMTAFWIPNSKALAHFTRSSMRNIAAYPLTIYPSYFQRLLTIIPYAFVNYYPCRYLLNMPDAAPLTDVLLSVIVGVVSVCLIGLVWSRGIRRYESSGS